MIILDIISKLIGVAVGLTTLAERISKARTTGRHKKEDPQEPRKHMDKSSENC